MNLNDDQSEISVIMESGSSEASKQEEVKHSDAIVPPVEAKGGNKKASFLEAVHETGLVAAKTVAGVGVGAAAGIGAVVAISIAEVTIPALLVVQIFSFAGGALGFLKGMSKK